MPSTISVLDSSNTPVTVATNDALATLIGEVQASPTSNTLLDRLKALATLLAAATPAGTNTIGGVSLVAAAAGGATAYHRVSTANTNAVCVKASAGTLKGITAFNINASPRYLKFVDKATAPTAGSETVVKSIMIPGNTSGGGVTVKLPPEGIAFATGIAFNLVTGMADTDSTGVAAAEILVELDYK